MHFKHIHSQGIYTLYCTLRERFMQTRNLKKDNTFGSFLLFVPSSSHSFSSSLPLFRFASTFQVPHSLPLSHSCSLLLSSFLPPFLIVFTSNSSFALAYSLSLLFSPLLVSIIPPLFLLYSLIYCRCSFFFL